MVPDSLQIVRLDDKHVVINNEMIINTDIATIYKDGDDYIVFEHCGSKYHIELSSSQERDEMWNRVIVDLFEKSEKDSYEIKNLREYLAQ